MVPVRRFLSRPVRPSARAYLLATLCGALVASGQAPLGWWFLALPALGVLMSLIAVQSSARAIWLGWAGGAGYFATSLFWIVEPFLVDIARHGWMAPFALLLMAAGMALFWGLAGALSTMGRTKGTRAVGFALGLAATDLLRTYIFTGFPWALLGHIWIDTPAMQASAFVGPIGLSLLAALPVALPFLARRWPGRVALAALGALVLGGVWMGGDMRLGQTTDLRDPSVRIRLIQPNAAQELKWQGDMWRVFLDRQMAQTALPASQPLDLIIWPETAVPYLLDNVGGLFADMAKASGGVPIATGIQRSEGARYFNSLVVLNGAGEVFQRYDKFHLVPFGEYIPFGDAFATVGISAFAAREGNGYTPGPGAQVLDLGRAGKALPLICYEAVFPQDLNAAPERADWIMQITNDSWFGDISGPYQHLAQARLRAVEQGLPLLRAANTGVTAVIDAKGQVLQSLALNTEGVIDADLPPALPPTVYAQTGDVPATIVLFVAFLALGLLRRRISD
ncbi:MAG: apolipoprotein N-acyltransferase [Albidovulum sp.]